MRYFNERPKPQTAMSLRYPKCSPALALAVMLSMATTISVSAQQMRVYVNGSPVKLKAAGVKVRKADKISLEIQQSNLDCYKSLLVWKYVEDLENAGQKQQQQQQQAQQRFSSRPVRTERDEVLDEIETQEDNPGLKTVAKMVQAKRMKNKLVYSFTLGMLSPRQDERVYSAVKMESPCDTDNAENTVFKFYVSK